MKVVVLARTPRWYGFRNDRVIHALMRGGHDVRAVVVENVSTLSSVRQWGNKLGTRVLLSKVLDRLSRRRQSAREKQVSGQSGSSNSGHTGIPVRRFRSHNENTCVEYIAQCEPDVLVLRGCGILRGPVLRTPRIGTINPHYASLPYFRGMDVTEWSILLGAECAVSVHWVTEEVDGGDVILSKIVSTRGAESLGDMRERCASASRELLAEALTRIENESLKPTSTETVQGQQYYEMHPRIRRMAHRKLVGRA